MHGPCHAAAARRALAGRAGERNRRQTVPTCPGGRPGPQPGQGRARLGCCQALPHCQGFLPSSPSAWAAAGPGQTQGAGWQGHFGEPPDSLVPSNPSARLPLARPSLILRCTPAPAHPPEPPSRRTSPAPRHLLLLLLLLPPGRPHQRGGGGGSVRRRGSAGAAATAAVPLARGASRGSASAVTGKGRCHLTPRPPREPMARAALSAGVRAMPCRDPSAPKRGRDPRGSSPRPSAHPAAAAAVPAGPHAHSRLLCQGRSELMFCSSGEGGRALGKGRAASLSQELPCQVKTDSE